MLVSLFTDASFYRGADVGGWGAVAISNRGKVYQGGPIPEPCRNSNDAEFYAVFYGLRMAAQHRVLRPKDEILLQCDNTHVIRCLETFCVRTNDEVSLHIHDKIRKGLGEWGCKLRIRHIKGHSETRTARTWVHDRCDSMAKAGAQTALKAAESSNA